MAWTQDAQGNWSHPVWGTFTAQQLGGFTPQQIFGTIGDSQSVIDNFQLADRTQRAFDDLQNADQQFNPDEGAGSAGSPFFANAEWDELLPRDVLDNSTFDPMYGFQNQLYGDGLWNQGMVKTFPWDPTVRDWSQVTADPTFGLVTARTNAGEQGSSFLDLAKDWATTFGPFVTPAFLGMTGLGSVLSNAAQQIPGVSEIGNFLSDLGGQVASGLDSAVGAIPGDAANFATAGMDAASAAGGGAVATPLPPSPGMTVSTLPESLPGITEGMGPFGGMSVNPAIPTTATDLLGLPAAPAAPAMSTIPGSVYGTAAPFLPGGAAGAVGGVGGAGAPTSSGGLSAGELDAITAVDPTAAGTSATNGMLEAAGITGGIGGAAATAAGATGTSALAKALGISDELASLLGGGASAILGANAAGDQLDFLRGVYNTQRAERAPFLGAATGMVTNPSQFFSGPIGTEVARATANALSSNFGNLFDNPTGQATMLQGLTGQYLNTVNSLGSLGLGGQGTQANLAGGISQAIPGVSNVVGGTLGMLSTPRSTLNDLFKVLRQNGIRLI